MKLLRELCGYFKSGGTVGLHATASESVIKSMMRPMAVVCCWGQWNYGACDAACHRRAQANTVVDTKETNMTTEIGWGSPEMDVPVYAVMPVSWNCVVPPANGDPMFGGPAAFVVHMMPDGKQVRQLLTDEEVRLLGREPSENARVAGMAWKRHCATSPWYGYQVMWSEMSR